MTNGPMVTDDGTAARLVAAGLLDIGAVHLRPDEPFTYTSGLKSPVYVDCRKLIAYPRLRGLVIGLMAGQIMARAGTEAFDAVAGGETAGIPFAAWLADALALPMLYVRKAPKGFGRLAQIEGDCPPGSRVLLVEDLATDGGSKLVFVNALRTAEAEVTHCSVVFHHDVFPQSVGKLAEVGVALHTLARWRDVLDIARARQALPANGLAAVDEFLNDPYAWSGARDGISAPA